MLKMTILYHHPTDAAAFETYYAERHFPIAVKMPVSKVELTKFLPGPDGAAPAFYRMAELYFTDQKEMQASLSSPEGQATVADLPNFATGGVLVLFGEPTIPAGA